jgi:hypothetical protein
MIASSFIIVHLQLKWGPHLFCQSLQLLGQLEHPAGGRIPEAQLSGALGTDCSNEGPWIEG